MDALRQDLSFALRSLLKSPGFTAIATLCMALGIAANVFVYSPVNALLVRPLPYRDSPGIMHLNTWPAGQPRTTYMSWSWPDYRDARAATPGSFSEWGAFASGDWNVAGNMEPERLAGARVTPSLFPMLGLRPALGRFFRPDEELGGRVVVIGHGVWQRKFGGRPDILGEALTLNGIPYTVVGVMQERVRFPEVEDLWIPAAPTAGELQARDARQFQVLARLAPGVTREAAEARLQAAMRELAAQYPGTNRELSAWMLPYNDNIRWEVGRIFMTMVGAVAFVLLIACSNVANLLLARGSGRQRELAVRLSMGATRGRIVRQLLTESLLLALLGAIVGVLLGAWATEAFMQWGLPTEIPWYIVFDVDRSVLLWTLGVTLLSGLVFGIAPALALSRPQLAQTIREAGGGRGGSAHGAVGRTRATLVVTQLALSIVLLVGAALMVQSFLRSQDARLGLEPRGLLTGQVALAGPRYAGDSARASARDALLAEIRREPGVVDAALAGWLPIGECCTDEVLRIAGRTYRPGLEPTAVFNPVSAGWFSVLRTPVLRGREFTPADRAGAARVAIISESLARREFGTADPVGQAILVGRDTVPSTVVGVVADVVVNKLNGRDRPRAAQLYVPLAQSGWTRATVAVRLSGDPSSGVAGLRAALARLDKDLPVSRVYPMPQVIKDRMFENRVFGMMFAVFGVAALLLASIGLYGVMSYTVNQRQQEMGVRIALGAQSGDVMHLVLGTGLRLLGAGLLIGVPAALGLAQLLKGSLYGISATDPGTLVSIPLVLSLVALVASAIPARRATRVDPIVAMRAE